MTSTQAATGPRLFPSWFVKFQLMMSLLGLVGLALGITGYFVDRGQNQERDRVTKALLGCFDEYAQMQQTGSLAIRERSVVLTTRQERESVRSKERNQALQAVFDYVTAGSGDPVEGQAVFDRLTYTNSRLVETQRRVVWAQRRLAEAREANPVPAPPSSFCEVSP